MVVKDWPRDCFICTLMRLKCPSRAISCSDFGRIVRYGCYYRTSDKKWIQRYKCTQCFRYFSTASFSPFIHQNKRQLNPIIFQLLASGVSQRRISRLLKIHMITVARKLRFLGNRARFFNLKNRRKLSLVTELQFDDLETFEHSKLKPLSMTLAVEKHSRFILGFEVSRMPAKGHIAQKSLKKYGKRKDERNSARDRLFRRIKAQIRSDALIESDENPHYLESIKTHFPNAIHQTLKGQRGSLGGQGELKKVFFDPLFSLNHTCAMFRANVNRLFRKTWCTTKKIQPLIDHLEIYTQFHNQRLI